MTEAEKRKRCLCFAGHRPEKLHSDEAVVCAILKDSIDAAIADGFVTFITGMARGVDYEKQRVMRSETIDTACKGNKQ